MEATIKWSPNSNLSQQHFLLADGNGRSFTSGLVDQYDGTTLKYTLRPSYRKAPQFRAFDWAPFDESLVAVGQWSGEVNLIRIDDGVPPISLLTKHQRPCNCVSFNTMGLLATGLERVRNVEGLNLWDANQRLSPGTHTGRAGKFSEPYRRLASSEAISDVQFFNNQPDLLIAGIKGAGLRMYDLRESGPGPSLQFLGARLHNIVIDDLDDNYFACVGAGKDITIQVWDRRSASTLNGSAIDSAQTTPVAEYSGAFGANKEDSALAVSCLRYCKGKAGFLGALASNGELKIIETNSGHVLQTARNNAPNYQSVHSTNMATERLFTKQIHTVEPAFSASRGTVSDSARIASMDLTNLAGSLGTPSFIILRTDGTVGILEAPGQPLPFDISTSGSLLVADSIPVLAQQATNAHDVSSLAAPTNEPPSHIETSVFPSKEVSRLAHVHIIKEKLEINGDGLESAQAGFVDSERERALFPALGLNEEKIAINEALRNVNLPYQRAKAGYGLDCEKNIEMCKRNRSLRSLWTWLHSEYTFFSEKSSLLTVIGAQSNADDKILSAVGLDLSYLGILSIWNCDLSEQKPSATISHSFSLTFRAESDQMLKRQIDKYADTDMAETIAVIVKSLDPAEMSTVQTQFPQRRQVCLHTCGLGFSETEIEAGVKRLIDRGQSVRAAALAVMHSQPKLAFQALRSGSGSALQQQLSLALAGYLNGSKDDVWLETVEQIASEIHDPYARAIMALFSHGKWQDVLSETSLPLRDRMGIALMYLNDSDLSRYLQSETSRAITEGDLEGIVLTGLTEQATELFENYIRRYFDLQTPVLALSFASPRFFKDPRITIWRETYRSDLDRWRLFTTRAKFDILATRLSVSPNLKSSIRPIPAQMSLRCTYCEQNLDRTSSKPQRSSNSSGSGINFGIHPDRIFANARSGPSCPRCGRHMPRCVVCMNWVGMPDAHTKATVAEKMSAEEAKDRFINVCRGCWHVSHAGHAEEWFRRHRVCPAAECQCRCVDVDAGVG